MSYANELSKFFREQTFMQLVTRGENLQPDTDVAIGGYVSANGERVTVYIDAGRSEEVLSNLNRNGKASLLLAHAGTRETAQANILYISSRRCAESDVITQSDYIKRMKPYWRAYERPGAGEPLATVAVTFKPEQISGLSSRLYGAISASAARKLAKTEVQ
ncbi:MULTISPECIES: pyridoxamine 5'-phosphate oxidase family protein [unclassified Paenibacillus]|uniref:pyridoxamine 5'-phosphate oxidase family protein n=1 Tax=unclassified Paenibacillus TaxID=185978 RepID=UPI001C0F66BC|nr:MULTISPECIES: pyridoxamine 5'-phosphate oxidase family protein [unclassified Paenibacillus]MBU5441853.1 pyridoxamine 5'-phosphate oxidase family protein [Paenibacillus sp. MSJ-34]CAH0119898.1 hypothetical protein PAE9249_02406 [Paenibacillus sp. CECT 9249]